MNTKFISWRRVSTFRQSKSGLGLEAQKEIIRYFIERDKGEWVADYEECYTGTELSGCTELKKAMEHAKSAGAILVIAKTDRFRNTIEALQVYDEMGDGNIMFCDLPTSDKFTLTLFFALAEREALIVSIRTKQALAVKKEQGCKLGAASPVYQERYKLKSSEERVMEHRKKGVTKNSRFLQKKDTVAFLKVLSKVFPDACVGEPTEWQWNLINTKEASREKIIEVMNTFKEIDPTLFPKWNLSGDEAMSTKTQVKMANQITTLRRSILRNETINNTFNQ